MPAANLIVRRSNLLNREAAKTRATFFLTSNQATTHRFTCGKRMAPAVERWLSLVVAALALLSIGVACVVGILQWMPVGGQ